MYVCLKIELTQIKIGFQDRNSEVTKSLLQYLYRKRLENPTLKILVAFDYLSLPFVDTLFTDEFNGLIQTILTEMKVDGLYLDMSQVNIPPPPDFFSLDVLSKLWIQLNNDPFKLIQQFKYSVPFYLTQCDKIVLSTFGLFRTEKEYVNGFVEYPLMKPDTFGKQIQMMLQFPMIQQLGNPYRFLWILPTGGNIFYPVDKHNHRAKRIERVSSARIDNMHLFGKQIHRRFFRYCSVYDDEEWSYTLHLPRTGEMISYDDHHYVRPCKLRQILDAGSGGVVLEDIMLDFPPNSSKSLLKYVHEKFQTYGLDKTRSVYVD